MSSLSSLLVQRELATIRDVEEALARQVLYGGDLATNLLEVAKIDEGPLAATLAESFGLAAAPAGELPRTPLEARALLTKELAAERGVIPLGLEGASLVLASSGPLTAEIEHELKSATGRALVVRIAPIFRIYQAIARDYEAALPRRYARLLTRLGGKVPPAPAPVVPARATLMEFRAVQPNDEAPKTLAEPPAFAPIPADMGTDGPPTAQGGEPTATRAAEPPAEPLNAPSTGALTVAEHTVADPSTVAQPIAERVAASQVATVLHPEPTPEPAPEVGAASAPPAAVIGVPDPVRVAEPLPTVRASGFPGSFIAGEAKAHGRSGPRRRGPLNFAVAKKELDEAGGRDAVLDLVFDFARQFFEFSAIFVVHGDLAEGRDAAGKGASRDKVASLGVPLEAPSLLASGRELLLPVFAVPSQTGHDAVLFHDLERPGGAAVVVVPIVVRRRLVALLLGDDGDANVEAAGVQEVVALAALAGAAFERLIVRKKKDARPTGAPSAAPGGSSVPADLPAFTSPPVPTFAPQRVPAIAEPTPAPASSPPAVVEAPRTPPPKAPAPLSEPGGAPAPVLAEVVPEPAPPTAVTATVTEAALTDDRVTLVDSLPAPASVAPASIGAQRLGISPRPMVDTEPEALPPMPSSRPRELESSPPPTMRRARESHPDGAGFEPPRKSQSDRGFSLSEPAPPLTAPIATAAPASVPAPEADRMVAAARVPPSRSDIPQELASVIVDVGSEYMALLDQLAKDGNEDAETKLLHAGQHAMPAILSRFPGPLKVDLASPPPAGLPRASECGVFLRLVARQRRVALPFLLTVVDERDVDRRFWATYLLSELPYIESIEPAVRALFDAEPRVRGAGRAAVRVLGELYPTFAIERLARVLGEPQQDAVRKVITLQLLGELREAGAVTHLIGGLADPRPEVAAAARSSLILVARQDFGLHVAHWNDWHTQNRGRQRVEWLIDALGHPASGIRAAALEELVKLSRNAFGYEEEMSKRDRERVLQRFRDWWAVEGRARFGR